MTSMVELMNMPLWAVCSSLQDRMANDKQTKDHITCRFGDITFRVCAESEKVLQSFEEYMAEEQKNAESP